MLRIATSLDAALEELIHRVIGCCIVVHKALGPGLLEPIYQRDTHRVDFIVADRLMLELKALDRLHPVHHAQVRSNLRISELKIALLITFTVALLPEGIKRIVL